MEPELPIAGRDVTLICEAIPGREFDELYIQTAVGGKCGLYTLSSGKCEKPTTTTCGIDPDILVTCGKSGTATPFIMVTKRNLDPNDNGLWECFGTGSPFLYEYVIITVGKSVYCLISTHRSGVIYYYIHYLFIYLLTLVRRILHNSMLE